MRCDLTLHLSIQKLTHTGKIPMNIQIADPHHFKTHLFQSLCANLIRFLLFFCIVTATIQFNNQASLCTIEINYVLPYCFLPLKSHRIIPQVFIP